MALMMSYYSKWRTLVNSDMSNIIFTQPAQPELLPELLSFNNNVISSDTSIDQLFLQPNGHFYCSSDSYNSFLAPEPPLELDTNLKRQKTFDGYEDHVNYSELCPPGPGVLVDQINFNPDVMLPPFSDFVTCAPPRLVVYNNEGEKRRANNGGTGSLSAQSMAARERRRKITDKTKELGKLVPGGHKMNTAEMFQAAYKYVKFLQAQVGILEFMGSYQQPENGTKIYQSEAQLHPLVESPLIQEKLYSSEKCLIPHEFVAMLQNDHLFPSDLKETSQLKRI